MSAPTWWGLRWNKLNQSFNTTSYVKKLHQRFTYHHYHQYDKFLLIIFMTGGPNSLFLTSNLTKSLTSIQTIWFAESLHYLPKAENEFSLFFSFFFLHGFISICCGELIPEMHHVLALPLRIPQQISSTFLQPLQTRPI